MKVEVYQIYNRVEGTTIKELLKKKTKKTKHIRRKVILQREEYKSLGMSQKVEKCVRNYLHLPFSVI